MDKLNKKNSISFISNIRKFIFKPEFSIIVMFFVMLIITATLQRNFFERQSLVRTINAYAPLILLTMGQSIVIIAGGLDLSIGTSLSLLTCVLVTIMKANEPVTGIYAILITFMVAVLIGVINGVGVGYLNIPPVIATFATSFIWLGAALFLRPTPGGESVSWFRAFYNITIVEGVPTFIKTIGEFIPPSFVLVICGIVVWIIISKTRIGRYIYAVGSNLDNAYITGINTARVQMVAYIMNSFFVFLAALFFVAQNQSGDARLGGPFMLNTIAAAVVGGIALSGGRGSVYFAALGALILSLVSKIIFFADIPNEYQTLINGLIVIIAISGSMIYTIYSKRASAKGEKKIA
jgi:ribose transport system permease protein